jgi:GT2 family glycosyltransferase
MDVSVIIVNWNSKDYLRRCLQSLARHRPALSLEVVVVDGGSYDGCGEMLAAEFPDVVFVQSPDNIGFARANNLGVRYARGRTLLLLNPDTELTEDSVGIMYRRLLSLSDAGAVGCRLINGDGALLTHSVQTFPTITNRIIDSEFLRRKLPNSKLWGSQALTNRVLAEVEGVSGACIFLKRECFEKIGGFSDRYFMYGEDIDLCFRIWRAGFKTYHIPETTVIHFVGGSSNQAASNFSTVMMRQSCFIFMRCHRGVMAAILYRLAMGTSGLIRLIFIPPLLLLGRRVVPHGFDSLRKWRAVLYWSLGMAMGQKR